MKRLLLLGLLCPTLTLAQKSFFDVTMGVDLPKVVKQGFSARLNGGVQLGENALAGAGIGVTKLDGIEGVYIPLSASFKLGLSAKKLSPLVVLEPGYGIYNHTRMINRVAYETRGGFTFFGGAGFIVSDKKAKPHLSVGYSVFTFETGGVISRYEGFSVRAGISLFNK